MNIILGKENAELAQDKYIVLELDQIKVQGTEDPVQAYCLVDRVPIERVPMIDQFRELHNKMMQNYRRRNWKFCQDALEHLVGQWNGEVDTFYLDLDKRIKQYQENGVEDTWDGIIDRSH